ncbi:siderophore-interacting protein [Mycobacterium sp. WMMD1722]|uniref:siderophore-interacting protein n=1 Tax=Mycobacterium sp. WMMD1722 TaxID=3404117 RepID=UPI003BF46026
MSFTYASVVRSVELTRRLRRITLHIDDPAGLGIPPAADAAVGVYFDAAPDFAGRNYSVRHHDADHIDIDVVLHASGPGTTWARTVKPGARVGLDHARSWHRPDPQSEWHLLISDLSGLPALARIMSGHPAGTPATAVVEVADRADLDYLPSHPDIEVVATVGTGNGATRSRLTELVRDLPMPATRGYCWFAGEAAESRAVRKHVRQLDWSIEQYDITGYWRADSQLWDRRFALVEADVVAVYTRALAAGKGDKIAFEEFDEALERVGL